MISYLLATKDPISESKQTLDSILSLPQHDREIVICCPEHLVESNDDYVWVPDRECTGSAHAYNEAYKFSKGDYIAIIIDDILLPSNFLDILDFMESDFMSKKKFKISNIMWDGGPGLAAYGHDDLPDGESVWPIDKYHPVNVDKCPYSVIPLPFFQRETIEKYLSNQPFHHDFKNHLIDHWLGFYLCKNESYEPHKWRCPSLRYTMTPIRKPGNSTHDGYDMQVLKRLTDTFVAGVTPYA